jgi:uncharacterized protein involved in exopolysaccharide biosynthesis
MTDQQPRGEPQGYFVVMPHDRSHERSDLVTLVKRLWIGRYWLIASTMLFGGIAAVHAIMSVPVYESAVVIAVRTQDMDGALGAIRGQLGGLASLAGVGTGRGGQRREEFIAFLRSGGLARGFVQQHGIAQFLFASRWDPKTQSFTPDSRGNVPTAGETAVLFMRGIRQVNVDERTGLIAVAMRWTDPGLAADWANAYVAQANELLRIDAVRSAEQGIGFLNQELAKTSVEPIRQSLFRLLEGRLNDSMLANVEREYAFKVIDPAVASEPHRFVRPRRVLETLIGILCGIAFGVLFVLWRTANNLGKGS